MRIAENIRRIRKEKHMTQRQLGDLCGMDEANIRKYELGKINPKIDTVERIAKSLGVSIIELMGLKADDLVERPSAEDRETDGFEMQQKKYLEDAAEIELLENYQKLNPTGKTEARKRVQELTEISRYKN